jgi:hypothetical protein
MSDMIPPKGSILRSQAELAVHVRRLGRALRQTPPYRFIEGLPWWTWYLGVSLFALWTVLLRDPGWMLMAAVMIFYGLWVRRPVV